MAAMVRRPNWFSAPPQTRTASTPPRYGYVAISVLEKRFGGFRQLKGFPDILAGDRDHQRRIAIGGIVVNRLQRVLREA